MTTVIAVYSKQGCIGRCDARCHEAGNPECDCICGGRNHGVGIEKAIANNHERVGLAPEDLSRFAELHGYDPGALKVYDTLHTPTKKIRRERKKAQEAERWRKIMEVR